MDPPVERGHHTKAVAGAGSHQTDIEEAGGPVAPLKTESERRLEERTRELGALNQELSRQVGAANGRVVAVGGVARDITGRKQMEERLLVADRMASIGTLAGGVAHEINNPLGYVIANLEYVDEELRALQTELPGRLDELKGVLTEARHGAERVRRIVRDLKTFSRADQEERGPV